MKFAIIGRTETLLEVANLLIKNGHELVLIVTCKAPPEYRFTHLEFEKFADKKGAIYIYAPKFTKELINQIPENTDFAISINYISIIPSEGISCFRLGVLNAHTGNLPRFRGNAVAAWAIINKEKIVVNCIHKMIGNSLDSGDIIVKSFMELDLSTKINDIMVWFKSIALRDFLKAVQKLESDPNYYLEKQSTLPKDILRCYPRVPEDGHIQWSMVNEDILRLINASGYPYEGAFAYFNDKKIYIIDAELCNDGEHFLGFPGQVSKINTDGSIEVLTGNQKLRIITIKLNGDEECIPSSVINSIRIRLN